MHRKLAVFALLVAAPLAAPAVGQDWTKSKWGPADEIGAANYITPELVVKAAQLVKVGKTYNLGIETNAKTPAFPPRTFKLTIVQPGQAGIPGLGPNKTTYNDDIIDGWVGVGSQIDGLGHIGVEHVYYNGTSLPISPMPAASRSSAWRRSRRSWRAACCSTWRPTSAPTSSRKAPPSTPRRSKRSPKSRAWKSDRAMSCSSIPAGSA